jgi:hypothetical protein
VDENMCSKNTLSLQQHRHTCAMLLNCHSAAFQRLSTPLLVHAP